MNIWKEKRFVVFVHILILVLMSLHFAFCKYSASMLGVIYYIALIASSIAMITVRYKDANIIVFIVCCALTWSLIAITMYFYYKYSIHFRTWLDWASLITCIYDYIFFVPIALVLPLKLILNVLGVIALGVVSRILETKYNTNLSHNISIIQLLKGKKTNKKVLSKARYRELLFYCIIFFTFQLYFLINITHDDNILGLNFSLLFCIACIVIVTHSMLSIFTLAKKYSIACLLSALMWIYGIIAMWCLVGMTLFSTTEHLHTIPTTIHFSNTNFIQTSIVMLSFFWSGSRIHTAFRISMPDDAQNCG